jgi:hypothetical protein
VLGGAGCGSSDDTLSGVAGVVCSSRVFSYRSIDSSTILAVYPSLLTQTDPPSSVAKRVSDFRIKSRMADFAFLVVGWIAVNEVVFFSNDDGSAAVTDCNCGATPEAFLPLTFVYFLLTNLGIDLKTSTFSFLTTSI